MTPRCLAKTMHMMSCSHCPLCFTKAPSIDSNILPSRTREICVSKKPQVIATQVTGLSAFLRKSPRAKGGALKAYLFIVSLAPSPARISDVRKVKSQ